MKQGEFKLTLGENNLTLRCTPAALRAIETDHGGLRNVFSKLYQVEFKTIKDIIKAGLIGGLKYDESVLEQEIFDHGLIDLLEPLTEFLNLLGNGGRPPEKKKDEPTEGEA